MKKTAYDVVKSKCSSNTEAIEFLKGKKLKVVSNSNDHNYGIGSVVEMEKNSPSWSYNISSKSFSLNEFTREDGMRGNWLRLSDCIFATEDLDYLNSEVNEINSNIEKLEAERNQMLLKIDFMKKNGLKEFSETEFKAYVVLQMIDKDMPIIEKAKVIASFIDN
jgi:hypothetical protein